MSGSRRTPSARSLPSMRTSRNGSAISWGRTRLDSTMRRSTRGAASTARSTLLKSADIKDKYGGAPDLDLHGVRHVHFSRLDHGRERTDLLGARVAVIADDV